MQVPEFQTNLDTYVGLVRALRNRLSTIPGGDITDIETEIFDFLLSLQELASTEERRKSEHFRNDVGSKLAELNKLLTFHLEDRGYPVDDLFQKVLPHSNFLTQKFQQELSDATLSQPIDPFERTVLSLKSSIRYCDEVISAGQALSHFAAEEGVAEHVFAGANAESLWGWIEIRRHLDTSSGDLQIPDNATNEELGPIPPHIKNLANAIRSVFADPSPRNAGQVATAVDKVKTQLRRAGYSLTDEAVSLEESTKRARETLKEIEKTSNDIDEALESARELRSAMRDNRLASAFEDRAERQHAITQNWTVAVVVVLGLLIVGGIVIATQYDPKNPTGLLRFLSLQLVGIVLLWLTVRGYSYSENLHREYLFKSTVARSTTAFRQELSASDTDAEKNYVVEVSKGLFASPVTNLGKVPVDQFLKFAEKIAASKKS